MRMDVCMGACIDKRMNMCMDVSDKELVYHYEELSSMCLRKKNYEAGSIKGLVCRCGSKKNCSGTVEGPVAHLDLL